MLEMPKLNAEWSSAFRQISENIQNNEYPKKAHDMVMYLLYKLASLVDGVIDAFIQEKRWFMWVFIWDGLKDIPDDELWGISRPTFVDSDGDNDDTNEDNDDDSFYTWITSRPLSGY